MTASTVSQSSIEMLTQQISALTASLEKQEQKRQKQEEEKKLFDASSFKVCPYRRAIFWVALLSPIISFSLFGYISSFFHPEIAKFIFWFSYIGTSITGDFLVYRVFKKKDSDKADAYILEKKYHLTLEELDTYIQKLVRLRWMAAGTACIAFGATLLSWLPWYSFWLSYAGTTLLGMLELRIRGSIKTPKKFFLAEYKLVNVHSQLRKAFIRKMFE